MLDSESQLREAIQKMIEPNDAIAAGKTGTEKQAASSPSTEVVSYVCPMPEHVSIRYDHGGNCPVCGMTLVPATSELLARAESTAVEHYTCPMPEHADVHEAKPGKCPRCGMTLIPVMKRAAAPAKHAEESATPVLYTCPMASHADVVTDKPGLCPQCEMKLVETARVKHGRIAEANWLKAHP
jgi:rubrerythrin